MRCCPHDSAAESAALSKHVRGVICHLRCVLHIIVETYPAIITVSLGEAVADAIAALGADEEKETVVIFGGPLLLDGLLDAAAISSRSPRERAAAERALASLLSTGAAYCSWGGWCST